MKSSELGLVPVDELLTEIGNRFQEYIFVGRKVCEDSRDEHDYTNAWGGETLICRALVGYMNRKIEDYEYDGSENE